MTTPQMACGVNVYCTGPDDPGLGAALEDMAALGYDLIAFGPMDPGATDVPALTRLLGDAGVAPIAMAGLTPETDISSPDAAVRARGLDALRATVDFAQRLGADQLNGVSYAVHGQSSEPFGTDRFRWSAETLGQAADYAASAGIQMNFEVVNRYETSMLNTAAQALDYLAASGSQHLKMHLDTYHMGIEEQDLAAAVTSATPKLGYLELGQSGRGSVLTGVVDVSAVVTAAHRAGYQGRFGVEAFTRQLLVDPVANALAIWRQTYSDPHQVAAEAIELVRSVYAQ